MTKDEALKLALGALEKYARDFGSSDLTVKAMCVVRQALAQPEQEPVAWGVFEGNLHDMFFSQSDAQEIADLKGTHAEVKPLYTAPQRTWVGLTDEEYTELWGMKPDLLNFFRKIEAKLKEKNT